MNIKPAYLVVLDLTDISRPRAEIGEPDDGIRRRAAGHLRSRTHIAVDRRGADLVNQRHAAFAHAMGREKRLIRLDQYIENRIANSENVVFRWRHLMVLLRQLRWREKSAPRAGV